MRLALGIFSVLALGLGVAGLASHAPTQGFAKADLDSTIRESAGALAAYEAATSVLKGFGSAGSKVESGINFVTKTNFTDILLNVNRTLNYLGLKGIQLKRPNNLQDGNPCPDDEEVFEGLCYRTCAALTNGAYPIRTTAFSCCMRQPCSFFNSKFTNPLNFCQGYDVGGHNNYGCPHAPGDCLLNEELHMGACYKQCAVLTLGEFPYRSSATTCCNTNNYADCLEYENVIMSANFSVGGGIGDEFLEAEMGMVHPPVPALAEEATEATAAI